MPLVCWICLNISVLLHPRTKDTSLQFDGITLSKQHWDAKIRVRHFFTRSGWRAMKSFQEPEEESLIGRDDS